MGYDVDFLQVGNGETSGDCIVLRFGDLHSGDSTRQRIVVIDGGFRESGEKLVDFIKDRYGSKYVDVVISTHLDRDHIGGLTPVLEGLGVGLLYMHRPWLYTVGKNADFIKEAAEARKSYDQGVDLETLAISKDIKILDPLAGDPIYFSEAAYMQILGPSVAFYSELLRNFDHNKSVLSKLMGSLNTPIHAASDFIRKVQETLDPSSETLDHVPKDTSPENDSSAIIYFNIDGKHLLFTGDAGVTGLHQAADYAVANGVDLQNLSLLDIPHHGSKHNIDSAFLNRINTQIAFISATKDSKKHPSPRVLNALLRRSFGIGTTENGNIWHHFNSPDRSDYAPLVSRDFVTEFGDDE